VAAAVVLPAAFALGVSPAIAVRPPTGRTISVRIGSGSFPLPLGFQGISIESSDVPRYVAGGRAVEAGVESRPRTGCAVDRSGRRRVGGPDVVGRS
jgi:hypothetical protein